MIFTTPQTTENPKGLASLSSTHLSPKGIGGGDGTQRKENSNIPTPAENKQYCQPPPSIETYRIQKQASQYHDLYHTNPTSPWYTSSPRLLSPYYSTHFLAWTSSVTTGFLPSHSCQQSPFFCRFHFTEYHTL